MRPEMVIRIHIGILITNLIQTARLKRNMKFEHSGFGFQFRRPSRVSSFRERAVPTYHVILVKLCAHYTLRTSPTAFPILPPAVVVLVEKIFAHLDCFRIYVDEGGIGRGGKRGGARRSMCIDAEVFCQENSAKSRNNTRRESLAQRL